MTSHIAERHFTAPTMKPISFRAGAMHCCDSKLSEHGWEGMLTVHKHALAGGGAGVVHSAACGYLHAAQAQLVVALVDAGVLHVELGDAAQGTQDSSARCTFLLPGSQSQAATYHELHAAHAKAVLAPGGAGTFAEGIACCAERLPLSCLLSGYCYTHMRPVSASCSWRTHNGHVPQTE